MISQNLPTEEANKPRQRTVMNWGHVGQVIAVIVLVVAIVMMVISKLPILVGCLIAALAVARLT